MSNIPDVENCVLLSLYDKDCIFNETYKVWNMICVFHNDGSGVSNSIYRIRVRNLAIERYNLYPTRPDFQSDFSRLKDKWNRYTNEAKWDITCISQVLGFFYNVSWTHWHQTLTWWPLKWIVNVAYRFLVIPKMNHVTRIWFKLNFGQAVELYY